MSTSPYIVPGRINKLKDGRKFIRDDWKYGSGLVFVFDDNTLPAANDCTVLFKADNSAVKNMNIEFDGYQYDVERGNFSINASKTRIFTIDRENGNHYLIRVYWGGPMNTYTGDVGKMISPESEGDIIFSDSLCSKSGREGRTYILVDKDFKNKIDINTL